MKLIDKIKFNLTLACHALFYAMKAGNDSLTPKSGADGDSEINHHLTFGGVMNDLLQQQETQQVKETRDEYYRVLNEADKYKVDVDMSLTDEGEIVGDMSANARKKDASDFSRHCVVYEEDDLKIRVIQDNTIIEKKSGFSTELKEVLANRFDPYDYLTILELVWPGYKPRFELNKFVNKIVVKNKNNSEAVVELYVSIYQKQFDKLSALFVREMNNLMTTYGYKSDVVGFSELNFITDKAWNSDNLCLFEYHDMKYEGISVFDGHFILRFSGNIISDGKSITEKFRMKEVDEKYEKCAPRTDAVNLFAADRKIKKEDKRENIMNELFG